MYTSWALWALWFYIFKARVLTWKKITALSKSMAPATKSLIHVCLKVQLAAYLTSSFQSVYLENFHWLLPWRIILSKESSAKWLLYMSIVIHWNMLYESILLIILKMGIIILVLHWMDSQSMNYLPKSHCLKVSKSTFKSQSNFKMELGK